MEIKKDWTGRVMFSNVEVFFLLTGGPPNEWPKLMGGYSGFHWDSVDHWELEEGILVPYLGGAPMDGPSLRLYPIVVVDSVSAAIVDACKDNKG